MLLDNNSSPNIADDLLEDNSFVNIKGKSDQAVEMEEFALPVPSNAYTTSTEIVEEAVVDSSTTRSRHNPQPAVSGFTIESSGGGKRRLRNTFRQLKPADGEDGVDLQQQSHSPVLPDEVETFVILNDNSMIIDGDQDGVDSNSERDRTE
jgi:hypothetical protein